MKRFLLLIWFIAFALILTPAGAQDSMSLDTQIEDDLIFPFFEALQNGDVAKIKQYLSTEMYDEYRTLLEKNKEYPDFLRTYYRDANFKIDRAIEVDGELEVEVTIEFANGQQSINKLRIFEENTNKKMQNDGRWKISGMPFHKEHDKQKKRPR